MGPVSFPEANSSLTLPALDASVMGDILENVGWEAVGGITGLQWVDSRATHFHKVTLKALCPQTWGWLHAAVPLARAVGEG